MAYPTSYLDPLVVKEIRHLQVDIPGLDNPALHITVYLSSFLRPFVFYFGALAFRNRWMTVPAEIYVKEDLEFLQRLGRDLVDYVVSAL